MSEPAPLLTIAWNPQLQRKMGNQYCFFLKRKIPSPVRCMS